MSDLDMIYPNKKKDLSPPLSKKGAKKPILEAREGEIPGSRGEKERKKVLKKVIKKERGLVHHTFDVFEDQLSTLRKIKVERQDKEKGITISQFVREALDSYLEKKKES